MRNDFEVIVLDDGSEDDTGRMVEEIAAGSNVPIRYEWQTNHGVSAARNRALALAAGKYSLNQDFSFFGHVFVVSPGVFC